MRVGKKSSVYISSYCKISSLAWAVPTPRRSAEGKNMRILDPWHISTSQAHETDPWSIFGVWLFLVPPNCKWYCCPCRRKAHFGQFRAMACAEYTARSFKCSRCDASFADQTGCKQHSNHPTSYCNRVKACENFARVILVEVSFRESDRAVEGSQMRQYSGDLDHDRQPNDYFSAAKQLDALSTQNIHI